MSGTPGVPGVRFGSPEVGGAALLCPEHLANSALTLSKLNEFLKNATYGCFGRSGKVLLGRIPLLSLLLRLFFTHIS